MKNEGQLDTDVLIVGRGGGSIEDLWSFNEEPVIEAIFKSEIPVISAVGHEIDNLLSDLVADRRAATPTQAAEILIPVKEELMNALILRKNTVNKLLLNKVAFMKKELEQRKNSYYIKNFVGTLNEKKFQLMEKEQRITRELKRIVEKSREQFEYRKKRFEKVDLRFLINEKKKQLESLEKQINAEIKEKLKELRKELQLKAAKLSKYSVDDILKQGYTITRKNGKIVNIFNSLLQILEDGHLSDAQGRVVDFKNTVIVMTTNLCSRDISKGVNLGFSRAGDEASSYEKMKAKVSDELKQHFRPEFLNRVDEIVVFHQLTQSNIERIVDLMVAQIESRLADRDMGIELTPAAKTLVAKRGFDPVLGARPLRRALQRDIEDVLAEKILFGDLAAGQIVQVDVAEEGSELPFKFTGISKTPPVLPAETGPSNE